MTWIITKDFTDFCDDRHKMDENNQFHIVSIKSENFNEVDDIQESKRNYFRLYDDDGNLYYEGYSDDGLSEMAFAPLDDFGMPNAGCTEIRYISNGIYETL